MTEAEEEVASLKRSQAGSDREVTGEANLDSLEMNELKGRLRQFNAEAELSSLSLAIPLRHGLEPGLQNSEATELLTYREHLSALEPGHVVYANDGEDIVIDMAISDIIDFNGELDRTG